MVDAIAAISAVVLLAVVTVATRVGGVWIMSYVAITPRIEAFLKYMSVSVLISIVAATTWAAGTRIWLGVGAAALVMVATRSAVGAMLAGTALAAFARNFGF
jgi:branched chain amino acid efflux pump